MSSANENLPMVSVIMITYGHENFIREAIEGVLNQKCDFEFELIISNDKSPDKTDEVVKEILKNHPLAHLVKYIHHSTNLGLMPNFLYSVGQGTGKYQAFCEGDDFWTDPLKLQKQVDFMEKNTEYSGCAHQCSVLKDGKLFLFNENVPSEIEVKNIIGKRLFHTATLLFKKEVLELFMNAPRVFSGDRLLFLCIAISGKFKYFEDNMCVYRVHSEGASSTARIEDIVLDLNSVSYLKRLDSSFPRFRYMSYVYATIGLCKNGSLFKRVYYLGLSFILSFSYFPWNLTRIISYVRRRV